MIGGLRFANPPYKFIGSASATAADAAHAAIDLFVVTAHLLQLIERLRFARLGDRRLGLALGRQILLLAMVAGLALRLGLDEAAGLDRRRGRRYDDKTK